MVNLDYSFKYGDSPTPQTQNNKPAQAQSPQDNVWSKSTPKANFDGYVKTWTDPAVCRKNPGTCPNEGLFYEKFTAQTPKENIVKELWQTRNPTVDPWIIPITDCELIRKSKTIDPKIAEYNNKNGVPSPQIKVKGMPILAKIVFKKSNNTTYMYDENGKFVKSYRNADGAHKKDKDGSSMETQTGTRYITNISKTPYVTNDDTKETKEHPEQYGPYIIRWRNVDKASGNTTHTGQFAHGTNNPKSIGHHVSHGCFRHTNEDITKMVKSGLFEKGNFAEVIE